jgi:hypothetical protein
VPKVDSIFPRLSHYFLSHLRGLAKFLNIDVLDFAPYLILLPKLSGALFLQLSLIGQELLRVRILCFEGSIGVARGFAGLFLKVRGFHLSSGNSLALWF